MRWKTKAALQNAVSLLPSRPSYATYYWLQRHFGGLRQLNPVSRLAAGIATWKQLQQRGGDPRGKTFLEVGTGRVPMTPLAYWLMGAGSVITIDLNPYLRPELLREGLAYMQAHADEIEELFGPLLVPERLAALLQFEQPGGDRLDALLALCAIRYIAPGDAARTGLDADSVDFHTSFNVFEHIPPPVLHDILVEGRRIVRGQGMFVHRIDYSDHFSHADARISPVNFLQYSDARWARYAGNRYMYMNRLRHDDYLALFRETGLHMLATEPVVHVPSLELLKDGRLDVDMRFAGKPCEVLATIDAWIVAQRERPVAVAS
jgi:hypothetical protein